MKKKKKKKTPIEFDASQDVDSAPAPSEKSDVSEEPKQESTKSSTKADLGESCEKSQEVLPMLVLYAGQRNCLNGTIKPQIYNEWAGGHFFSAANF